MTVILEFLGHKGQPWLWQIEQCLLGGLSPLETRFYGKSDGGRPVANVCVSYCGGLGILGHVFTAPEHRGRGYAAELVGQALEEHGGRRIYLGCDPDSPAERLYLRAGFVRLSPGFMAWGPLAVVGPGERRREALKWHHWPMVVDLGARQSRPVCWEGRFLEVLRAGGPAWIEVEGERAISWSGTGGMAFDRSPANG